MKLIFSTYPPPSTFTAYTWPHTAPRAALLVTGQHVLRSRSSVLSVFFSHYFFVSSRISAFLLFIPYFCVCCTHSQYIYRYTASVSPGAASRRKCEPRSSLPPQYIFTILFFIQQSAEPPTLAVLQQPLCLLPYSFKASLLPPQLYLFYSAVRSSFFKSYSIANPKMIRTFSIVNQF